MRSTTWRSATASARGADAGHHTGAPGPVGPGEREPARERVVGTACGELHHRPERVSRAGGTPPSTSGRAVRPHRPRPAARTRVERRVEVVDLEREVVGPVAVPGEEAGEEVVRRRLPRLEQLDRHALGGVAEPDLHGPEPGACPPERTVPPSSPTRSAQRPAPMSVVASATWSRSTATVRSSGAAAATRPAAGPGGEPRDDVADPEGA